MLRLTENVLWAGSEESLLAAQKAEELALERMAAGWGDDDEEEDEAPRLLSRLGDNGEIGVVSIKGGLVNSDAWYLQYVGLTGYPEIREAMIEAANNPEIKHIVLDVDSGGGAVSGVDDTAKLIRSINDGVKPVTAFTDGSMMSAAYWLGAAAGDVFASKGAGAGSIGVIATHMEHSERLKTAGIGVNVIRAGKYKALANGYEKLTEDGRAQIQQGVDAAYDIFKEHVGEMRSKSVEFVENVMAQGRVFYGQAAADASLVDSITTFEALMSRISAKLIASSNNSMDNRGRQGSALRVDHHGGANMARKTLTEQDIAALAAGVTLGADASPVVEPETGAAEAGAADAADAGVADAGVAPEAAADAVTKPEAASEEVAKNDGALKLLASQLKDAQGELLTAKVELAKAQDKMADLEAAVNPLKDIAVKAANNMRVALGGSALDMSAASPAQVLADHANLAATFTAKFKVGGVSATEGGGEAQKKPVMDARTHAMYQAVRTHKGI
jgi:capsid assembly protease